METSLFYKPKDKNLCIKLRQKLDSEDLEFKFNGLLNTSKGNWYHHFKIQKPLLGNVNQKKKLYRYRKISKSFVDAGIGTELKHHPIKGDDIALSLWSRSQISLNDIGDTWGRLDTKILFNSQSQAANFEGRVRLNKVFPNITARQDAKVTLGCDISLIPYTNSRDYLFCSGFIELKENNWGILIDQNKSISLTYQL